MNFQQKYLKYKKKYLRMKLQMGGDIGIIKINENEQIDKGIFLENVIKNGKVLTHDKYAINLNIRNIIYLCLIMIDLSEPSAFVIYILNNKCSEIDLNQENITNISNITDTAPITIYFNDMDTITTKYTIANLPETGKPLDTIMELLNIIYKYFGYKKIELSDVASFKCPELSSVKNNTCTTKIDASYQYNASIYRILGTNNDANNISVYNKFGYKDNNVNRVELLRQAREYKLQDFNNNVLDDYIKTNGNSDDLIELKKNIDTYLGIESNKNKTIHDFFKQIVMNNIEQCASNHKFFNVIDMMIKNLSVIASNNNITRLLNSRPDAVPMPLLIMNEWLVNLRKIIPSDLEKNI